ncbi:hypothetical protein ZWY2020_045451 [Hordeum vulgare]|nr:hypothetical protein ZWY2020_045451 [Hordeum vulgare]
MAGCPREARRAHRAASPAPAPRAAPHSSRSPIIPPPERRPCSPSMPPRASTTSPRRLPARSAEALRPAVIVPRLDVVVQAGSPRTITDFQTQNTPVLLAARERADLATEKYIPLTPVLEGFVILRKNPEHHED